MALPLLVTKLYLPAPRPGVVPRPHLIARLDEGLPRKLTLVSAPAGFGKTTLVSEWVAASGRPAAWLSLDEADSDPARFLAYLIAALRTVAPDIGDGLLDALQSAQPPPAESILTALVNELATLPHPLVLVLDDYHAIDAEPIDRALAFLLDHLPPQLHLAITSREDPRLPLARLRARGQLTEVRAAGLRFTQEEAATFFNQAMGLDLSARDIAALETRTEGWIAGLQLAALSMRGRDDIPGFIAAFAGDDRYVIDYLVEEVLERLPEHIRAFLLQTSMLDRLSGPLCDAVTGGTGSTGLLDTLERGNLFLVPLDDKRHWYRYHHLFADVLRTHALEEPERVAIHHRRASVWYERHGLPADAIRHALAAGDAARAADLVELTAPAMRQNRQEETLLGWLRPLPDEVLRCRPVLSNLYAGVLLQCGLIEGAEAHLRDAERWLEPNPSAAMTASMVVIDEAAFRHLPAMIPIHRAGLALALGDVAASERHARRALDLVAEDDLMGRGAASALLGLAAWTSGDLEAAHRSYGDGMASLWRAGYIADTIGGVIALADIRIAQGRLREAMGTYERALRLATGHGPAVLRGAADMHVGMAELLLERNDLDAARQHLRQSAELGEHTGFPQHPYRWRVATAGIRVAEGDLGGAVEGLDEAERRYVSDFYPNVRPIAAVRARVWIAQERLADAEGWARERGLTAGDDLSYLHEYEHITLARLLIALGRRERDDRILRDASSFLDRLLEAAMAGERAGSVIEIAMLLALAHEARGDTPGALAPLARALTLAEPEGYFRLFAAEGAPMARLLAEAASQGIAPGYTGSLLAAFGPPAPAAAHPPAGAAQPLDEPLSQRELDVLRLIAAGLSNREIGERLYLALDTVKGHNRRIFAKLGVQRRTEALSRARELGLI